MSSTKRHISAVACGVVADRLGHLEPRVRRAVLEAREAAGRSRTPAPCRRARARRSASDSPSPRRASAASAAPTTPSSGGTRPGARASAPPTPAGRASRASSGVTNRTRPRRSSGCANAFHARVELDLAAPRREPVAEPAVDRLLARPERGDRLARARGCRGAARPSSRAGRRAGDASDTRRRP